MTSERIPRVIHYCWFSGEPMPAFANQCIDTWKRVMPDYELRLWDASSFDFASVPFVKDAFESKKWAFVADYIRLHALYHEGGIYLDSDVRVFRRFDPFLGYNFFTSHEFHPYNFTEREKAKLNPQGAPLDPSAYVYGLNVQAAIMGAAKGCNFLRDCMAFYRDKRLVDAEGNLLCEQFIIGPFISKAAERYGYRYHTGTQRLDDDMIVLDPTVFVGNGDFLKDDSYAIHLCNGSWKEKSPYEQFKHRMRNNHPWSARLVGLIDLAIRGVRKLGRPQRLRP